MKVKDIDVVLRIKNFKVGKFLSILIEDSVADFERSHPRIVPSLLRFIKKGDPRESLEYAEAYVKITEKLHSDAVQIKEWVEKYMVPHIELPEEGVALEYINTDGDMAFTARKDEEIILGRSEED